jgi:AraC-like DNA-binding protein
VEGLGGTRQDRRGILRPDEGAAHFRLTRPLPSEDLRDVVDRHWIVRWDLRGRPPFRQAILPHPCVHIVFEQAGPAVYGIADGQTSHLLEGVGEAVGVKFRPGAFSPFSALPATELTGTVVSFAEALGPGGEDLAHAGEACATAYERIALVEAFLRERRPPPDLGVQTVVAVADAMREGPADLRVSDVAAQHGLSMRSLQRLFRAHVGVSPKWVLQRYRLHEAAERMAAGEETDPATLALDLGYFDQAHFGNDFRRYVGIPPAAYAAMCAAA